MISLLTFSPLGAKNNESTISGNYLSWIFFEKNKNLDQGYKSLKKIKSSIEGKELIQKALYYALLINNWEMSLEFSKKLLKLDPSNFFSNIILSSDFFIKKDFESAKKHLASITKSEVDSVFLNLIENWISFSAEPDFKNHMNKNGLETCSPLECLHTGIMYNILGNKKKSNEFFGLIKDKFSDSSRFSELLMIKYLENNNTILLENLIKNINDEGIKLNLKKFKLDTFDLNKISKSDEALAEVYFNISGWFFDQKLYKFAIYFSNIGLKIRPDFYALKLLSANLYDKIGHQERSLEIINSIIKDNIYDVKFDKLELKILSYLEKTDKLNDLLKSLILKYPEEKEFLLYYAHTLRSQSLFKDAIKFYNTIIDDISDVKPKHWNIFYSRGISYERMKKWNLAEKDFVRALELNPEAAYVLNYLAYSWLERGVRINEAFDLLSLAVEIEPNDAYILDSLGWAYFHLGDYKNSIDVLEHALRIMPSDPTLNNHLGDVYWKSGRFDEAVSQWKKVLIFDPNFEHKNKVLKKIKFGI